MLINADKKSGIDPNVNQFRLMIGIDQQCLALRGISDQCHDIDRCCGQLWVRHMICGQTCDGLYHLAFCLTISTLAVKLSVSAIFYPRWTATIGIDWH